MAKPVKATPRARPQGGRRSPCPSEPEASVVRCPGGRRVTGQDGTAAQWVLLALWNQWSPEQKFTKLPNVAPREARLQEFFD